MATTYDSGQLDSILQTLQGQIQKPQGVLGQLDPMKLALAQGFFAPTKTGGFGESVSNALGALQSPLKTMADQNSSIQDKITQIKLAQAKLASSRNPEDAEDARNDRLEKRMQKSALDNDIRQIESQIIKLGADPDQAETVNSLKAQAEALRSHRDELIGLKRPTAKPPAQSQPQPQTQNPSVGVGQIVVQNGKRYKVTGVTNGQVTSAEEIK